MKLPAPFKRLVFKRIASSFRSLFLVFLLFTIHYSLFTIFAISPASAQTNSPDKQANPFTTPNTNPDVPKNLHTYTQNVIIEIMSAVTCQLTGIDPVNQNQQCLGVDQKTGKIGFVQASDGGGGAIGVMGKMISILYTPPLHTGDYFNHLAQNFGIAKSAYAQNTGTGFEGLKPLLGLWTAFRNIVYLIFTIVFVVIGLAIMFRIKIDPRTVMTIQNQIPKIIVGIVLVTFSYAIAGFLIDMMYTSIYVIGNVLTSTNKKVASDVNITGVIQSDNPFSAASQTVGLLDVTWKPAETVGESIKPLFHNDPAKFITSIIGAVIGSQVTRIVNATGSALESIIKTGATVGGFIFGTVATGGNPVGGAVGATAAPKAVKVVTDTTSKIVKLLAGHKNITAGAGALGGGLATYFFADNAASFVVSLLAFLVIFIAVLWSLFRLWFVLIMAYIYILIDVVFAPFWIAGGIIPGQPVTFGGWLRHILSYIAVFPTTIALFLLGKVFISAFGTDQKGFVPPLIGNPTDTNAIGTIIGLGIILMTPNVLKITQAALKAPKLDVGSAMQAIGVGAGVFTRPVGALGQATTFLGGQKIVGAIAGRFAKQGQVPPPAPPAAQQPQQP